MNLCMSRSFNCEHLLELPTLDYTIDEVMNSSKCSSSPNYGILKFHFCSYCKSVYFSRRSIYDSLQTFSYSLQLSYIGNFKWVSRWRLKLKNATRNNKEKHWRDRIKNFRIKAILRSMISFKVLSKPISLKRPGNFNKSQ